VTRRAARAVFWLTYEWFAVACEVTGHWRGCALLNRGPVQYLWAHVGYYGEYGFHPRRRQ
jgi:hypothetical protein